MGRVNIAIIDDGVNQEVFENIVGVYHRIQISDDMQIHTEDRDHGKGYASHGTECASILCRYCKDCNIVSIRILDEEKKDCNIEKLIVALEWCIQNEIQICSLSLGSIEFREQMLLADTIRRLVQKDIIIVAAMANEKKASYPADLIGVIRVKAHEAYEVMDVIPGNGQLFEPDFWAPGFHQLMDIGNDTYFVNGNSYAVPVVVAQISKWKRMKQGVNLYQICAEMGYENKVFMQSKVLTGMNRDIFWYKWSIIDYLDGLENLPFYEIKRPVLAVSGKKKYDITYAFMAYMEENGYSGISINISDKCSEDEEIAWISNKRVFIKVWGYLENYFNIDFSVICVAPSTELNGKLYDIIIDSEMVTDEKAIFCRIKNIFEDNGS